MELSPHRRREEGLFLAVCMPGLFLSLLVELVPHWRKEEGLRLVCMLGHFLSLLKPPKLERRGASDAQIVWEASEKLKGTRKPSKIAVWASVANNCCRSSKSHH